jgi:hypothetical protein
MKYEDERRKKYLKMKSQPTREPVMTKHAPTSQQKPTRGKMLNQSASPGNVKTAKKSHCSPEVEASYRWLSGLRPLTLADRVKKEYLWKVVIRDSAIDSTRYSLQWFDKSAQHTASLGEDPSPIGSLNLEELVDLYQSGESLTQLTLVVGESPRALLASGGRTVVVIECGTPGECAKYRLTLQTLRLAK